LSEHFQKTLHCEKDRRFQIPCQPSGRRVIPSGRPSVHCSIRPDNVSYCPDARQTSIIRPDDVSFRPDPPLYREASVPACIRPDLSASHPDVHQGSISFRFFPSLDMGRLIHRLDDMVSRPDALIHKARIAIQISPSGRQSALVRTRAHQLRKLPI
jgi:hypothetical protein